MAPIKAIADTPDPVAVSVYNPAAKAPCLLLPVEVALRALWSYTCLSHHTTYQHQESHDHVRYLLPWSLEFGM